MSFYQKTLGGKLDLQTYPDPTGERSNDTNAPIMHSQLSRGGAPMLMASDSSPDGPVKPGNNFSISVECESLEEIERVFAGIGEKGSVRLPLGDMPWGARFGMLTDQFGIQWMLNCYTQK